MVVAFLEEKAVGQTLEPPKNAHITLKKKFKLHGGIEETTLISLLSTDDQLKGSKIIITGGSKEYGGQENMILEVKNPEPWVELHKRLLELLSDKSTSRDPHFEGWNYLPHITWKLKGEKKLNPDNLKNKSFKIDFIYLIERVHPTKSIAKIAAKIPLQSA